MGNQCQSGNPEEFDLITNPNAGRYAFKKFVR